MRLTKAQQREHRRRCLEGDRHWISSRSDDALRWAIRSAASRDPHDELCACPYDDGRGNITDGPLPMFRQALAEEVMRRAAYPPGTKLPPVRLDPHEPPPAPRTTSRRKRSPAPASA